MNADGGKWDSSRALLQNELRLAWNRRSHHSDSIIFFDFQRATILLGSIATDAMDQLVGSRLSSSIWRRGSDWKLLILLAKISVTGKRLPWKSTKTNGCRVIHYPISCRARVCHDFAIPCAEDSQRLSRGRFPRRNRGFTEQRPGSGYTELTRFVRKAVSPNAT